MATFNKNKLNLASQAVVGAKTWHYTDTGLLIADVSEVAGFFTTGYDCGMRRGDRVEITEGDTGTYDTTGRQTGGRRQYVATILASVDTGATQVTLGLPVLVGDTS
jgi:hypothetical protein